MVGVPIKHLNSIITHIHTLFRIPFFVSRTGYAHISAVFLIARIYFNRKNEMNPCTCYVSNSRKIR